MVTFAADHTQWQTPHSAGLLWTRNRPVTETSTSQHTIFVRDKYPYIRRDANPQSQQQCGRRPTTHTARPPKSVILIPDKHYIYKTLKLCALLKGTSPYTDPRFTKLHSCSVIQSTAPLECNEKYLCYLVFTKMKQHFTYDQCFQIHWN